MSVATLVVAVLRTTLLIFQSALAAGAPSGDMAIQATLGGAQ